MVPAQRPGRWCTLVSLAQVPVVILGPFMRNGSNWTSSLTITDNGKWAKFAYDGVDWYFMHYNQ